MVNLDTPPPKNIWIAAGEGDLERVKVSGLMDVLVCVKFTRFAK